MSVYQIVLDTNIVSYFMRGNQLAEAYRPHVHDRVMAISFITVGELYFGAEKKRWGSKKRQQLEATLHNFVVIPYDREIARCFGRLRAEGQRSGKSVPPSDAWIAACAVRHKMPLITHNAKDFRGITDLQIITEMR